MLTHAHACMCPAQTHTHRYTISLGFKTGLGWVGGEIQFGVGDGPPGRACTRRVSGATDSIALSALCPNTGSRVCRGGDIKG